MQQRDSSRSGLKLGRPPPRDCAHDSQRKERTPWLQKSSWGGWIVFAGIVLFIIGSIDVLQGLVAILEDEFVVETRRGLAIVDATTWGWITLLWGVLIFFAGLGLLGGAGWARWLAIIGVGLNAIEQIAFMANFPQAYPLWNLLIVALNVLVLFALTARWQGYKQAVAA